MEMRASLRQISSLLAMSVFYQLFTTSLAEIAEQSVSRRSDAHFCAEGWTRMPGLGCYLYLPQEMSWEEASLLCQDEDQPYVAKLVEVEGMEEARQLAIGASFTGFDRFWVGLTDIGHLGKFHWMHTARYFNSSLYENGTANMWIDEQEEGKSVGEYSCVAMNRMGGSNYKWKRLKCMSDKARVLCEAIGHKDPAAKKNSKDKNEEDESQDRRGNRNQPRRRRPNRERRPNNRIRRPNLRETNNNNNMNDNNAENNNNNGNRNRNTNSRPRRPPLIMRNTNPDTRNRRRIFLIG